MKSYGKPELGVLTLGVAERIAIDACEGTVSLGGTEYHWRVDGPSYEDWAASKGGCVLTILDGLTVS